MHVAMETDIKEADVRIRAISALEALADERRLRIVELLAGGEKCLCDISATLGISDALASHHVKRLRTAGVVMTRRSGTWLHCRLDEEALSATAQWLDGLAQRSAASPENACCRPEDCL